MNVRTTVMGLGAALVLALAGCATDGLALTEVGDSLGDYEGTEITTAGEVGRGVPVSGTDFTVYQFAGDEQTVAVLSTEAPDRGDSREVTGRVVPFSGEFDSLEDEEEGVRDAVQGYLEDNGVSENALEAATDQAFNLVRTFTLSNQAPFFMLEEEQS
ncbi:MAG: hypothetical protein ACLFM0_07455 [Spirochaetales bacterium]